MRRAVAVVFLTAAALVGSAGSMHSSGEAEPGLKLPWSADETYRVLQGWGGPTHVCPEYNCYAYDFALPADTPVKASAGGTVTATEGSYSAGGCDPSSVDEANYVLISHSDGSRTLYLHLRDVVVSDGQDVKQGELIGYSGQTGYACSAHLHFQRDVDGVSAPVYFDEYPGRQLKAGQSATSRNSPCQAWPADFNDDQKVDGRDVFLWAQRFGSTTTFAPDGKLPFSARYDLNVDGAIDGSDIFILAQYFNQTCA